MAKVDGEALRAQPLLLAAFEELLRTRGAVDITRHLGRHLVSSPPPTPGAASEDLVARSLERVLDRIDIDPSTPAWVYVWRANVIGGKPAIVRVQPWSTLPPLAFRVSAPADVYAAKREASLLWDEAIELACALISNGSWEVFGRVGKATDPYRLLDSDLTENLIVERDSNDGLVKAEKIYSIRVRPQGKKGRPSKLVEQAAETILRLWPSANLPSHKVVGNTLRKEGVEVSASTLARAIRRVRSGKI